MTTKPPSGVNYASDDNFVKKIYSAIDELKDVIPVDNERYRLSFCFTMYFNNEIENMLDTIDQADPRSSKIDYINLEKKINQLFIEKGLTRN
jgi:hypothetical protein